MKIIFVNSMADGKGLKGGMNLTCPHSACILTRDSGMSEKAHVAVFNPIGMAPLQFAPKMKPANQLWASRLYVEACQGLSRATC